MFGGSAAVARRRSLSAGLADGRQAWGGSTVADALEGLIREGLDGLEFDLVELRRGGPRSRPVLEVRIDRRDGQKVTIDDCARVSRALEGRLDASGLVDDRYVLEVSSPGADRPLNSAADWRRFVGRRATVTSGVLAGGRQEVDIVAVDGDPGAEVARVRLPAGDEVEVPLAAVTRARLAFHWKR
jgi:ribosome maturation factor RimP